MGKGRNGRHRAAKLTVREELMSSNAELQAELHEANSVLAEMRARHRADMVELRRLQRFETEGLDLDRLARVLKGARDRIHRREEMLMQVTRAFESEQAQATYALARVTQLAEANEHLRSEVRNLKQVAEERRVAAEEVGAMRVMMKQLARERDEAELAKLQAQVDLERLRAMRETTPTIGKKEWRLLAGLVHPDVHVPERRERAHEAMLLLNTTLRPS
jgi:hypothetical protein